MARIHVWLMYSMKCCFIDGKWIIFIIPPPESMVEHDLIQDLNVLTKWSNWCSTLKHANMSKICQFGKYPIITQHWIGGEGLKNVVSLRENWSFYVKKRCMSLIFMRAKIFYRPRGFWHNFNIKFMFCENSWIFCRK